MRKMDRRFAGEHRDNLIIVDRGSFLSLNFPDEVQGSWKFQSRADLQFLALFTVFMIHNMDI